MRPGQAAVEFLMIYGVAIILVFFAVAALIQFEVFEDPRREPIEFGLPLPALQVPTSYHQNFVELTFINTLEEPIKPLLTGSIATRKNKCWNLTGTYNGNPITANQTEIPSNHKFSITWHCPISENKVEADLAFTYLNTQTGQLRTHIGSIAIGNK